MIKVFSLLTTLIFSFQVLAWETDNFTHRRKILKASDSEVISNLYALNDEVNKRIRAVVDQFNQQSFEGCRSDSNRGTQAAILGGKKVPKIFKMLKSELGGGIFGAIEVWSIKSGKVKSYGGNDNIYGSIYEIQNSFNLAGTVTGPDKLGHFFDQGFDLYEEFNDKGKGPEGFKAAMKESNDSEEGFIGLYVSGIKSYGDMGSNFSGMKFWYNLVGNVDSYLRCNYMTGKYEVNRDFDWSDFVNDSWDEGISCSFYEEVDNPFSVKLQSPDSSRNHISQISFTNKSEYKVTRKDEVVNTYLKSLDPPLSCPDNLNKCRQIAKLKCSKYFVSPKCLSLVPLRTECNLENIDEIMKIEKTSNYKYDRSTSDSLNDENINRKTKDI